MSEKCHPARVSGQSLASCAAASTPGRERVDARQGATAGIASRVCQGGRVRGFSLLELLVVLGVIAIMAALAAPSVLTISSSTLRSAGEKFEGFVNSVRGEAGRGYRTRLVIVREWKGREERENRYYGALKWNEHSEQYEVYRGLRPLPEGVLFERSAAAYVESDGYPRERLEPMRVREPETSTILLDEGLVVVSFVDFLPDGSIDRANEYAERTLAIVLANEEGFKRERTDPRSGDTSKKKDADNVAGTDSARNPGQGRSGDEAISWNWVQVNIDAVTGRTWRIRP